MKISERLTEDLKTALAAEHVEVIDQSHRHRGHAGALEGGHFDAVIVSGDELAPVTLFVNRDSGLIERVKYDGPDGTVTEEYSDYRIVEGVKVPFHTVVKRPGAGTIERDIRRIHFNVSLPPGLFSRPS